MSSARPDIPPPPSGGQPLPLEAFLDALRREGFAVDADHYHEAPQLLNTLAAEHTFEELKTLLAPLFVRNRQEQQRFYTFFDRYFSLQPIRPAAQTPRPSAPAPMSRAPEGPLLPARRSFPDWLYAVLAILLFIGLFFGGYYLFLVLLSGSSLITAGLIGFIMIGLGGFHNVLKRRLRGKSTFWYGIAFIALFVTILAFALPYLPEKYQENGLIATIVFGILSLPANWYLSRPKKEKKAAPAPAARLAAPLRFPPAVPFPRLSLIGRTEVFHISRHLNRLQADSYNTREIDIPETLERTVRKAGIIDIAFQQVATRPHYLLLIDAAHANEHEVEWFDYLLQTLQGDETRLERYFFEHDPSFCWLERGEEALPLQNLYGGQRLILLSDGYALADPVSGGLFDWALGIFSLWTEKALLSYRPVDEWGYFEQQLAQEFCLAPSTVDGLMEAVAYFDNRSEKSLEDWHRENTYDVLNTNDTGLIRRSLPPEVFEWLCACALYPELNWKLTLHLGEVLEPRPNSLLNQANLTLLNRLKWFREGQIPDQARAVLAALLPEETAAKARKALAGLLARPASEPPRGSYAYRQYRQNLLRYQFELAQAAGEEGAAGLFRQLQLQLAEQGTTDAVLLALVQDENNRLRYGLPLETLADNPGQPNGLLSRKPTDARICWAFYRGGESLRVSGHLEERLAGAEQVLLLISGIEDSRHMVEFARAPYLEQEFDVVLTYEYNRLRQGLDESAQLLKKWLSENGLEREDGKKLSILAHSTGGLVARYYIEHLDGNRYVQQAVLAGTPNGGMSLIRASNSLLALVESFFRFVPFVGGSMFRLLKWLLYRFFPIYQQIEEGSAFMRQLNREQEDISFQAENVSLSKAMFEPGAQPGIPYAIVAGNAREYYRNKTLSRAERLTLALMDRIYNGKGHDLSVSIESMRHIGRKAEPAPAFREVAATHITYYTEAGSVQTIRELLQRDLTIEELWQEAPEEEVETAGEAPEAEAPAQETSREEAPAEEGETQVEEDDVFDSLAALPSRWVLASGRSEMFADGPTEAVSPFMYSLLSFLRENKAVRFPVSQLGHSILERASGMAGITPSSGPMPNVRHEGGEFIFYTRPYLEGEQQAVQQKAPRRKGGPSGSPDRGRAFLLSIAIDQYQSEGIPPLANAVRAARELLDILTGKYQFEARDTFALYDIEATRDNIFSTFERVLKEARPDDEVLIFFAGHGEANPEMGQSYWLPADARPGRPASYISSDEILRFIRNMAARHVLLITDAPFEPGQLSNLA